MGHNYEIITHWEKIVADYLNTSILEIDKLDIYDYLLYRRDAFIHKLSQTETGTEYLNNAFRLEQTTMSKSERAKLKKLFSKQKS